METQRLRECLDADFRRMREAAAGADLAAPVPSCPGWTTADLVRHIGEVYLHKVECMRLGRGPEPWPPASLRDERPLELLDRGYAALVAEFAARRPEEHAFTWYDPDQTVGFWIRRMAQETVIHRVDAELAAGVQVTAVADDLAADGIDEVLVVFMEFATAGWPEEFAETLASAGDRTVALVTPQRSWPVRLTAKDARVDGSAVDGSAAGAPSATVAGPAPDVLLWLWSRGGGGVETTGDQDAVALLRQVLVACTQ